MSDEQETLEAPVREMANSAISNDPESAAREELRARLASDVDAFLKKGGNVEVVPAGKRADPPKKPEPKYGGGSI